MSGHTCVQMRKLSGVVDHLLLVQSGPDELQKGVEMRIECIMYVCV